MSSSTGIKIFADGLNKDCNDIIDTFYTISDTITGVAKMMTLNKEFNKHAKVLLSERYGKKLPKNGVMHMGRMVTKRNHEIAKKCLLPGINHSEALVKMECMLCKKRCPSVSTYGFVAHSQCVKKHEKVINGKTTDIDYKMVRHLPGLRKRELYTGGCTYYAISDGIRGVYPRALSINGYTENNRVEIAVAREIVAREDREKVEREVVLEKQITERRQKTRSEIEAITGVSFGIWTDNAEETVTRFYKQPYMGERGPDTTPLKGDYMPAFFWMYALDFKSGQDAMDALAVFKKYPFLEKYIHHILASSKGEVIDTPLACEKMEILIRENNQV